MEDDEERRRNSISAVGPYARVRIIVAILLIAVAFVVIGWRALNG